MDDGSLIGVNGPYCLPALEMTRTDIGSYGASSRKGYKPVEMENPPWVVRYPRHTRPPNIHWHLQAHIPLHDDQTISLPTI